MTTTPKQDWGQDLSLAFAELLRARDIALHNATIHEAAGDSAQAELCREVEHQCNIAILLLA